jgi:hypothetical protein
MQISCQPLFFNLFILNELNFYPGHDRRQKFIFLNSIQKLGRIEHPRSQLPASGLVLVGDFSRML